MKFWLPNIFAFMGWDTHFTPLWKILSSPAICQPELKWSITFIIWNSLFFPVCGRHTAQQGLLLSSLPWGFSLIKCTLTTNLAWSTKWTHILPHDASWNSRERLNLQVGRDTWLIRMWVAAEVFMVCHVSPRSLFFERKQSLALHVTVWVFIITFPFISSIK